MKILIYLLIMTSIAFADDCFMAKVAARKSQDNTEILLQKIDSLRMENSALKGQMNSLSYQINDIVRQNQELILLVKDSYIKPSYQNRINKEKSMTQNKQEQEYPKIEHKTTPESLKAIPNKPLSAAPKFEESDDMKKWRECAKRNSMTPCLKECFNKSRISLKDIEKCDQECKAYQRSTCGQRPNK